MGLRGHPCLVPVRMGMGAESTPPTLRQYQEELLMWLMVLANAGGNPSLSIIREMRECGMSIELTIRLGVIHRYGNTKIYMSLVSSVIKSSSEILDLGDWVVVLSTNHLSSLA